MELRTRPGHVSELIDQFNELSSLPASPENMAGKLAVLTEAVTYCIKFNTQTRQAQRVANFLGEVMADKTQEETVHMVASMAFQTMLNHIRPVDILADKPLRQTRRWNMGTPAQRVHAGAMSNAVAFHVRDAVMREALSHQSEPHQQPSGRKPAKLLPAQRRQLERAGLPVPTEEGAAKRHKPWKRGAGLGKKPEPVT